MHAIPDDSHGFIISPHDLIHSPAVAVSDLDFADDIALLSHNHENAQALLTSVEQEALTVGLKINCKKTEYMPVGDFKADPGLIVIGAQLPGPLILIILEAGWCHQRETLRFDELRPGRHASGWTGSGSQMCPATSKYVFVKPL